MTATKVIVILTALHFSISGETHQNDTHFMEFTKCFKNSTETHQQLDDCRSLYLRECPKGSFPMAFDEHIQVLSNESIATNAGIPKQRNYRFNFNHSNGPTGFFIDFCQSSAYPCSIQLINETDYKIVCTPEDSTIEKLLMIIYPSLHATSILFMLATLLYFCLSKKVRNTRTVSVLCLLTSLAALHSGYWITSVFGDAMADAPCIATAIITHFTFLSSNCWLTVSSFETWLTFRDISSKRRKKTLLYYSLYAWGLPLLFVGIGQIMDNINELDDDVIRPQFGVYSCWFFLKEAYVVYLYAPVAFMDVITIFLLTSIYLRIRKSQSEPSSRIRHRLLRLTIALFISMTVPWLTEIIIYCYTDHIPPTMVSEILKILTGFSILPIFVCLYKTLQFCTYE